ncbi:Clp protease ClpP [Lysinibacillus sphaericus]|uniref:head maturation protease, ClpP-related n=1 Tax=Lysinibacillus sphaericus TaxID=1421 RepID=UPI0018CEE566|nr:head maturation protease, ClpP-related [Lysinibacillus sphaericus]MBG9692653.1 Clp protease ClpP [Lysinibacillus sphaericus]
MSKKKTFFDIKASVDGKSADVFILGEITTWAWEEYGEMSSVIFKEKLDAVGDVSTIHLYVNSPGGSVFEGIAIANMLKRHKARVIGHVEALAASIASNIIASCDEVRMPSNSMLMIHNALNGVFGNAKELRKAADDLDRINEVQIETYMAKVGNKATEEQIRALMDEETWISAKEAYELGLCDVVDGANQAVASLTSEQLKQFKNVPKALIVEDKQQNTLSEDERNAILADSKANLTYLQSLNLI